MSHTNQALLARRGLASIKLLVALPSVLMLGWLGVELGLGARAMSQARSAADAVALAAAARAREGFGVAVADAQAAAAQSKGPNGPVSIAIGDGPDGGQDVEFGRWDEATRAFVSDPDGGEAVRVRVRFAADHPNGSFSPLLSGFFGAEAIAIERTSVAVHVRPRHTTSMLLLGATGVTASLTDTAVATLRGGMSVASAETGAVVVGAGAELSATVVRVEGTVDASSAAQVDATVVTGFDVPADPFAAVQAPLIDSSSAQPIVHDDVQTTMVAPGVHSALTVNGGSVVLQAGLHQFTGPVQVLGGSLVLQGATIQIDASAGLSVAGTGALTGTPDTNGDWAGAWAFQRGSTVPWSVGGQGTVAVEGLLYLPDGSLALADSAQVEMDSAVVSTLSMSGTSSLACVDDIAALATTAVPGRARLVK